VEQLPVTRVMGQVVDAARDGACVLVAPPGTGKTTLVPLALADAFDGRIIVAEPRRIAARAAARRMAELRGERVGESVGYSVRGDRKVGRDTRVEVVTTGLLVQRLLADPELAGVGVVMLDECHERQLDTDLATGFLVEAKAALRPELRLLATSATAEAERFAALLGGPIVQADSPLFPIEMRWSPPTRPVKPPHGLRVDPAFLDHVAAVTRKAWQETEGDLLVFLPGAGEIESVRRNLRDLPTVVLHGRLPAAQQDDALTNVDKVRRVVLATAVAESSLTVPGVRVVVDSGLARVPRTDHARGLGSLVTVRAARASTVQRAGRAAREAPGTVYRCWSQVDDERLPAQPEPEISTAELTGFALALACWGHPDGTGLALPDAPPEAAMRVARTTLQALGAVDADGRVTPRGRRIARVGAHPRLARALLDGGPLVGARRAAEVVAILAEDTVAGSDDLAAAWRRLRNGRDAATGRWRAEADRLHRATETDRQPTTSRPGSSQVKDDDLAAGLVVGLAYPERLARARSAGGAGYLMAGGTEATLANGSGLTGHTWLAIAVADRPAGSINARVRLAAAIDEGTARETGAALLSTVDEVTWTAARRVERLGAIALSERDIANPPRDLVETAVRDGLRREGLGLLRWTREATQLRERMAFCHRAIGEPWPDVGDAAVIDALRLGRVRRKSDLSTVDVERTLRAMLPWPAAERFDRLAPERMQVPSGSQIRVDYSDPEGPVLAVKVQEAFGWSETPVVGGRQVLLHLLSPAGRPVAVTRDLVSFWRNGYPQVRAELRGRYPRHPWPEDPTTATPTRRTKR
jgi:ATP-dependent helicase HrpB